MGRAMGRARLPSRRAAKSRRCSSRSAPARRAVVSGECRKNHHPTPSRLRPKPLSPSLTGSSGRCLCGRPSLYLHNLGGGCAHARMPSVLLGCHFLRRGSGDYAAFDQKAIDIVVPSRMNCAPRSRKYKYWRHLGQWYRRLRRYSKREIEIRVWHSRHDRFSKWRNIERHFLRDQRATERLCEIQMHVQHRACSVMSKNAVSTDSITGFQSGHALS